MKGDAHRLKRQFEVFEEVHRVQNFRLVLCVDVFDCMVEYSIEMLSRYAKAGHLLYEPLIIFERRSVRTRFGDTHPGRTKTHAVAATAL